MDRINDNDNDMYVLILRYMTMIDLDSELPAFLRGLGSFFV